MTSKMTINQDGKQIEIEIPGEFETDEGISAAKLNELFRRAGVDVTRVAAMTPAMEILNRLRRLEYLERLSRRMEQISEDWLEIQDTANDLKMQLNKFDRTLAKYERARIG